MKIVMLDDRMGSENGYDVDFFRKGKIYDVGESLGSAYINEGHALAVEDKVEANG